MISLRLFLVLMLLPLTVVFTAAMEQEPLVTDQCGIERANEERASNVDLQRCAAEGEPRAQAALGFLYWVAAKATYCRAGVCSLDDPARRGLDSNLTLEELRAEGLRLIEAAARGGSVEAQNELGAAYLSGDFAVPVDFGVARTWLQAATEGGDAIAPYNLARIYFAGLGVEQSLTRAEGFLRLAAERSYGPAQCSLIYWLSQYSDRRRQQEADALRATVARAQYRCSDDDLIQEMPLIRTSDTL